MTSQPSHKPVRKAVFPVAGLGTRFLPATKSVPKEMLTVVDRPVLQYAVDEARKAGIEHCVFVTGRGKGVIEDHFDIAFELEQTLAARGKQERIDDLHADLPQAGQVSYTRQQVPLGLGHAVWCARDLVGDEPFALLLPDMLMKADVPCLKSMIDLYNKVGGNVVGVEQCAPDQTSQYGIVGVGEGFEGGAFRVSGMVEKPAPDKAPSTYFLNGRYILQPEIFNLLGQQERGSGGEIQLTDAMVKLAATQDFTAQPFTGRTFDCGSKIGFLEANITLALDDPHIGAAIQDIINKLAA